MVAELAQGKQQSKDQYTGKRAAIYLRVSTLGQEEKGIPQQLEACRQHCQKVGFEIVESCIFQDVKSGTKFEERTGLQALLLAGRQGEFDVCVTWRFDRFSRDQDDFYFIRLEAKKHHWLLESTLEGQHDPNNALDTLLLNITGYTNQIDRTRILQNFQRGKSDSLRRGKLPARPFPLFGYKYPVDSSGKEDRSRYEIDLDAARIVRKIFDMTARGVGARKIVEQLEADAEPTPGELLNKRGYWTEGRPIATQWQRGQITKILHNPTYYGEAQANRYYKTKREYMDPITKVSVVTDVCRYRPVGAEELVSLPPETCPPIVDKALALAAREAARRNQVEASKDGEVKETLLLRGGIVRCGYCHSPMYGINKNHKRRYWCALRPRVGENKSKLCSAARFSWLATKLDEYVWAVVVGTLVSPTTLSLHVQRWERLQEQKQQSDPLDNEKTLLDRIKELERALNNARKRVEKAEDDEEFAYWEKQERDLKASLLRQHHKLTELRTKQTQQQDYQSNVRSLTDLGSLAKTSLHAASLEEKREVLHWLGVWVEVWKKGSMPDKLLETATILKDEGLNPYLPEIRPDVAIHIEFNGFHLPTPHVFADVLAGYAASNVPRLEALPS